MEQNHSIASYQTSSGIRITRLPLEAFPNLLQRGLVEIVNSRELEDDPQAAIKYCRVKNGK